MFFCNWFYYVCRLPMQNCIKKNLVLVAEENVLSLEVYGIPLVNLRLFVGEPLVKIGKEVYDLAAVVCKH